MKHRMFFATASYLSGVREEHPVLHRGTSLTTLRANGMTQICADLAAH